MTPTISVLMTDTGTYPITEALGTLYRACKIRADGQPDARTRYGRLWYREFAKFQADKLKEYMAA